MGIKHQYTSTCTLCGAGKNVNTIVYGDYDGDEGEGSTHSYKDCAECAGLKKASPFMFKMAVKQYNRAEKIEARLTKKFKKELEEDYIWRFTVADKAARHRELGTVESLKTYLQDKILISKSTRKSKKAIKVEEEEWILSTLLEDLKRDFVNAVTHKT